MGYEVKFLYFEKDAETKEYNREEEKTLVKKIGKSTEEVPLEKLAFVVMNQMARRDIWVEDVEIYEFVKKKISFKESSSGDGIIIGGKKFGANRNYDNVGDIELDEERPQVEQPQPVMPVEPQQPMSSQDKMILEMQRQMMEMQKMIASQQSGGVPQVQSAQNSGGGLNLQAAHHKAMMEEQKKRQAGAMNKDPKIQPIRYEYFKPDPELIPHLKEKGAKFTLNKRYPIYDERMGDKGYVYVTENDEGDRIMMHSVYFVPNIGVADSTGNGLLQSDNTYNSMNGPKLTYDNGSNFGGGEVYHDPETGRKFGMPDVRRDINRLRR